MTLSRLELELREASSRSRRGTNAVSIHYVKYFDDFDD